MTIITHSHRQSLGGQSGGQSSSLSNRRSGHGRRAFTLVELLAVMGILLLLSVLTVVAVGRVTQEARLSSGTNSVRAALGVARGLAIQRNSPMLVAFIPAWDENSPDDVQVTQIVIAEPTGRVTAFIASSDNPPKTNLNSEFRPVRGIAPQPLPVGINVAGPQLNFTGGNASAFNWLAPPDFRNRERGQLVGVLFGPDGRVLSRLPGGTMQGRQYLFVNMAGRLAESGANAWDTQGYTNAELGNGWRRFYTDLPRHEPNIDLVNALVVFDEREARELYDVSTWRFTGNQSPLNDAGYQKRQNELTEFINLYSNRLAFNRYSGVVQR